MSSATRPKPKVIRFNQWIAGSELSTDFPVAEFAVTDDRMSGTVVTYGDVANFWFFTVEIAPGALELEDTIVNRQHMRFLPLARMGDEYLAFEDSPERLRMSITGWPEHSVAQDTKLMVEQKLLRGLSAEIHVTVEQYDKQKDHLTVIKGSLSGVAIVDKPAFPQSTIDAQADFWRPPTRENRLWLY